MSKLFTYGTLMNGTTHTHRLPGYMMFRVQGRDFSFPVIQPYPWLDHQPSVFGTVREVDDGELEKLDIYENVKHGLYRRVEALVFPLADVALGERMWVYIGGPALVHEPIPDGIWR